MSAICRLSVPLAVSIFGASVAVAETMTVGTVDKVQADVDATQAGQTRALRLEESKSIVRRPVCKGSKL